MKHLTTLAALAMLSLGLTAAQADVVISSLGTPTLIDFDNTVAGSNSGTFTGSGLDPVVTGGRLDSNSWQISGLSDGDTTFGGTFTTGDFARGVSEGMVTTGGIYSFDTDPSGLVDRMLGVQPGGSDFTPGSITLRLQNNTGTTVSDFDINYEIWYWNDQSRSNSLNFSYSTDGVTFTPVASMDFETSGTTAPPRWEMVTRGSNIGISLADGAQLFLRWSGDDVSGGGSRDEYGLDDISIAFNAIPEPGSMALMVLAGTALYIRRRRS